MNSDQSYHLLLRQFEDLKRQGDRTTPLQFIQHLDSPSSDAFSLEVVAIDIELTLMSGQRPNVQNYVIDFPHLANRIPDVFASVIDTFVATFCPVRHSLGGTKRTEDYDIEEEIGRGGRGVVYQAIQKSIGRKVAVKVRFLSRDNLFEGARNVAELNHPNICKIYDAGKIGEFPFVAMQLIRGESLRETLSKKRLPIDDSVAIVIQIADALATAHLSNLAHCDVKPENVLINDDGTAWIMDLGLARKQSEVTAESSRLPEFSPNYCAPEQLSFQYGECGFISDIYSLGLVLYELLTGRRAYHGDLEEVIDQIKHDPPRRLTDYDPTIPHVLEEICLKAIMKQPEDRFESMAEFHDALRACPLRS